MGDVSEGVYTMLDSGGVDRDMLTDTYGNAVQNSVG